MDLLKLLLVGLMVIFSLFGTISAQCGFGFCPYPDTGNNCGLQYADDGITTCGRTKSFAYFLY